MGWLLDSKQYIPRDDNTWKLTYTFADYQRLVQVRGRSDAESYGGSCLDHFKSMIPRQPQDQSQLQLAVPPKGRRQSKRELPNHIQNGPVKVARELCLNDRLDEDTAGTAPQASPTSNVTSTGSRRTSFGNRFRGMAQTDASAGDCDVFKKKATRSLTPDCTMESPSKKIKREQSDKTDDKPIPQQAVPCLALPNNTQGLSRMSVAKDKALKTASEALTAADGLIVLLRSDRCQSVEPKDIQKSVKAFKDVKSTKVQQLLGTLLPGEGIEAISQAGEIQLRVSGLETALTGHMGLNFAMQEFPNRKSMGLSHSWMRQLRPLKQQTRISRRSP